MAPKINEWMHLVSLTMTALSVEGKLACLWLTSDNIIRPLSGNFIYESVCVTQIYSVSGKASYSP
jgi:hypothetical protein